GRPPGGGALAAGQTGLRRSHAVAVMSTATASTPEKVKPHARLRRIGKIVFVFLVLGGICLAFGWDIRSWFSQLWDVLTQISIGYIIAGCALATVQTTMTALGWFGILRAAYGPTEVR